MPPRHRQLFVAAFFLVIVAVTALGEIAQIKLLDTKPGLVIYLIGVPFGLLVLHLGRRRWAAADARPTNWVHVWAVWALMSLVALGGGLAGTWSHQRLDHSGERTDGLITDLRYGPRGGNDQVVVAFTAAGQPARQTFTQGSNAYSSEDVGTRVEVAYDPEDPARARIAGSKPVTSEQLTWVGAVTAVVTVPAVLIAALIRRRRSRSRTPQS